MTFTEWFDQTFRDLDGGTTGIPSSLADDLLVAWNAGHAEGSRTPAPSGPRCDELLVWSPIISAPKNGMIIDLWHSEFGRHSDVHWGVPQHCCGEAGQHCDSEWHGLEPGWVDSTFNEMLDPDGFTHWMRRPEGPSTKPAQPLMAYPDGLKPGLYEIFWKSGGSSLAAIGMKSNGDRWMAPTNWVAPTMNSAWSEWADIERAERVEVPRSAASNDDALEYALGALRSIAASGKNSTAGQLAAMAQAGIDLATLGEDECAEMRGDAAPRNGRGSPNR